MQLPAGASKVTFKQLNNNKNKKGDDNMEKLPLFIYSLLINWMGCYANKEPNIHACIDNYELSFFCDSLQFNQAKDACKNRKSYVVKIDNANMTEIIGNTIDQMSCKTDALYIGGTADGNRKWTWLDGSKIYLRNEEGYQNWQPNQPNDVSGREDCMRIKTYSKKWIDVPCSGITKNGIPLERRYYICQKNIILDIEITESSSNAMKCSATSGICVNQVEWRRNTETVSNLKNHSVYQELSSGTSTLHYEKASINDGGEYTCVTWVLKNKTNRASASKNVTVDGSPRINETVLSLCNTSLFISWNPNPRAIGFHHRIKVNDAFNGDRVKDITETPIENVLQVTQISGLQPNLAYHIQITACNDEETCTDEYTVNTTVTTGGMVIENATMRQISDNDTCIITWNWPYDISTVFELNIKSDSGVNTSNVERPVNYTDNKISYSFEMQPEQVYEVQIHSNGSDKICPEPVNVTGSCRGRDKPTTTSITTPPEPAFTTDLNEAKAITMIVIPVSVGVFVILIIAGVVIFCIRRKRQDVKISKSNPIYGVTNKAASESTYDHLHSSSEKSNKPDKSTRKLPQPSPEVVFNPLYGDIGMDTSPENQDIDAEANTEDNDAPVYAEISKPKKKIPHKVSSLQENVGKQPSSTAQQDDNVYAVVDKKKKKN